MPEDLYTQGMLGIYEHNDISLLKDVFMWAYERSALRYSVIRQSLGEPDPFRLKYRNQMKDLISSIIKNGMSSKVASESIQAWLLKIEKVDRKQFVEAVETEILSIHEGNFARYKVSPNEFKHWKSNW